MEQKIIVTVIDGVGIITAKNDRAEFSVSVRAKSESSENAKRQVEEKTTQVLKALDSLKDRGMQIDGEISTSLSNYRLEHRESGERTPVGFQSINTITWTVVVNDSLDEVYKTALKFDPNMARPYFSIKNREVLSSQAVKQATDNAKEKLQTECSLLGVSCDKLTIQNWNFGYEGHLPSAANFSGSNYYNGAQGVTGPQGSIGSVGQYSAGAVAMKIGTTYQELLDQPKLEPGHVTVRVAVRVNYVWA